MGRNKRRQQQLWTTICQTSFSFKNRSSSSVGDIDGVSYYLNENLLFNAGLLLNKPNSSSSCIDVVLFHQMQFLFDHPERSKYEQTRIRRREGTQHSSRRINNQGQPRRRERRRKWRWLRWTGCIFRPTPNCILSDPSQKVQCSWSDPSPNFGDARISNDAADDGIQYDINLQVAACYVTNNRTIAHIINSLHSSNYFKSDMWGSIDFRHFLLREGLLPRHFPPPLHGMCTTSCALNHLSSWWC